MTLTWMGRRKITKGKLLKHTSFFSRKTESAEAMFQNEVVVGGRESLNQGIAAEDSQKDHGKVSDMGQQERETHGKSSSMWASVGHPSFRARQTGVLEEDRGRRPQLVNTAFY